MLRTPTWIDDYKSFFKAFLNPKPNTGSIWLDLYFVFIMSFFQILLGPLLIKYRMNLDLLTPWLLYSFIQQNLFQGFFLLLLGALTLETYGLMPAGIYVVIYLLIFMSIHLTRHNISWRRPISWVVTYMLSQAGVEVFLWAVQVIGTQGSHADKILFRSFFFQLMFSFIMSLVMFQYFSKQEMENLKL